MAAFLGKRYIGIIGTGAGIGQGGIYIQTASGAAPYVPPIDSMTASPEFAWSVWQMSASQTQCVRLRRDSDNAESDFGFSANGLVDVSAINTWLGGANAYVVTLYGVTRSATETTAAEQFQWFNSGGLDNKPYFAFFNNSGVLADERYLLSTDVTTIVDYDIFVGCNFTKANSFSYHFTTANSFRGYFLPNFNYLQTRPNAGLILNSSAIIDGDNLFELNRSSGTVEGFANQISFGTGANTDNTTISHLFGQGVNTEFVSELVLFKSFLSIPDRSIYLSSYNSRYNKSLPTGPAELYFAAVEAQGGTLTETVKNEFTAFVNREVDAGRWSKIKRLYPYLGGVINSARIDAITLNQATNFNFVDADADPLIGLQGDGSTKHLRAGYSFEDVVTDPKDKLQYGVFTDGFSSVGVRNTFALAALDTVAAYYYYPLIATSGTLFSYIGTSSAGFISGATNTANLRKISGARFSTTSLYALLDGVESAENTNDSSSVVAATREICLFGRNLNGTFRDFMTEKAVLMYMSEFDTLAETKAFENSYETFLTNITASSFDPDAEAYFTAAGITDPTEKAAVNQLVLDLKGTGSTPNGTDLWTDAAAFYPISPTSLSAAAYNLRDTTSFNMTWANSPTHASTGVTFNGSTQYGDTGFNPNVETLANGYDITLGAQIVNASVTAVGLMSAVLSTSSRTGMLLISGNIYQDIHNTAGGRLITSAGGTLQGRMIVSADRIANGGRANYLNGTSLGTASTESQGIPVNLSLWVGAQNNGSGGQNFTAIEMRFGLIIPKGLNATAVADLDDAIVRYSTALSRNV